MVAHAPLCCRNTCESSRAYVHVRFVFKVPGEWCFFHWFNASRQFLNCATIDYGAADISFLPEQLYNMENLQFQGIFSFSR